MRRLALALICVWSARILLDPNVACADTLNVQIINVCDSTGQNCALSNTYAGTSYSPTAIQNIFSQAGISVNLLAPVQFDSSTYLNPAVVDDPANGYLTGSPTDAAHQLLALPGHDQNTDSNVLNVFVVNSLPHTTYSGGTSTAAGTLFGLALENSNGAIVTTGVTGPDSAGDFYVAGLDNLAHELGHNLGLLHVDGTADSSPYNLMQGTGRYVPVTLCGIIGTPCDASGAIVAAGSSTVATTGLKDALTASQITEVQSAAANLFSANGASASAEASMPTLFEGCSTGVGACAVGVAVNQGNSSESLVGLKLRFRLLSSDPNVADLTPDLIGFFPVNACGAQFSTDRLPGGDAEISVTFQPGCFTGPLDLGPDGTGVGGDVFSPLFYVPVMDPNFTGVFNPIQPDYDLAPFSIQFQFSDGTTTTSLFDSSGNATSQTAIAISNPSNPQQSGPGLFVPTDPALFNATSIPEDDVTTLVLADGSVVPAYSEVPEPGSLVLLGTGLLGVVLRRRR